MALSRQHYVKFAEILKRMHGKEQEMLAIELLKMFKEDNPRFDSKRFLQAAGIESNQRTAPFESKKPVTEAFEGDMKLSTLLPAGRITTLRRGGSAAPVTEAPIWKKGGATSPDAEFIQDSLDDFEDAFDEIQEKVTEFWSALANELRTRDELPTIGAKVARAGQQLDKHMFEFKKAVRQAFGGR